MPKTRSEIAMYCEVINTHFADARIMLADIRKVDAEQRKRLRLVDRLVSSGAVEKAAPRKRTHSKKAPEKKQE